MIENSEQPPEIPENVRALVATARAWLVVLAVVIFVVLIVLGSTGSALNAWQRSKLGPLHKAACDGDVAECERLVNGGTAVDSVDENRDTPLDWAVYNCQATVVKELIELGADPNHVDERGFSPLMYTATSLRGRFPKGTEAQRNDIARILIEHGANVNYADGGTTTLHFAAGDKNAGLIQMLLAAGADQNVKSDQGYTPLDIAKFSDFAPNDAVIAELQRAKK